MTTIKKVLLLTGIAVLFPVSAAFPKGKQVKVTASTHYVAREVADIQKFDRIIVNINSELEYRANTEGVTSLTIEIPDNLWEYLDVKSERGTLRIGYRKNVTVDGGKIKIVASSPSLDGLTVGGACDAELQGRIVCENFYLKIAGLSNVKIEAIDCRSINANISGGGNVTINQIVANVADFSASGQGNVTLYGKAQLASYNVSGSGDFKADQMQAHNLSVKVSGTSTLYCYAYNSIIGSVSGMGKLYYSGSPSQAEITGRTSAVWQR